MTTVKPDGNHAMRGFFGRDLIYVLLWAGAARSGHAVDPGGDATAWSVPLRVRGYLHHTDAAVGRIRRIRLGDGDSEVLREQRGRRGTAGCQPQHRHRNRLLGDRDSRPARHGPKP